MKTAIGSPSVKRSSNKSFRNIAEACIYNLISIVFSAYILLYSHRMAHDHEVLYKAFCNQHATLQEANEDNKVQVLCAHFYQTAVLSELHVLNYLQDM